MAAVDECKKIIKKAAKERLAPLGFFQVGQTRSWVRDDGWYFTVADFAATADIPCAALFFHVKFLWGDGADGLDIHGVDYGRRERFRENYEGDQDGFYQKMLEFCDCAEEKAAEYARFRSFEYADRAFEAVRKDPYFLDGISGPWQNGFWNCWHCAMYNYFRGRPDVGDEMMRKYIAWRVRVDYIGLSKEEEEKIRKEYMKTPEYILGKRLLDMPPGDKQAFLLGRIAEHRRLLRSKSSWRKLAEDPIYG